MAIRDRAKALFKTKSKSSSSEKSSSLSKSSTQERWPSNVYKPGEPMPRPKYRAPPKKEHKEKLEAFSFAEAWRRKSFQSQYSPMGTRAPSRAVSRRNSWLSIGKGRKSMSGRSMTDGGRSNSVTSASTDGGKGGIRHREHLGVARKPDLSGQEEVEGDDDVHNVGISRVQSKDPVLSRPHSQGHDSVEPAGSQQPPAPKIPNLTQTLSTAHDHQPFTEQDLALALHRSHLAVPAH